jgi:hypothetical protein
MAQREPGRLLLKVAAGEQDLVVAVMVVRCLPAGERVQLLAGSHEVLSWAVGGQECAHADVGVMV